MAVVYEQGISLAEINKQNTIKNEEESVGFFESALAGVATGLWNIPKGVFSFGAEIYDLIGDTNTAKEIEDWFDDVNPWDDEAEARTVGKVTQAITQVAPMAVGGAIGGVMVADRVRKMAQTAIAAKKSNRIMNLSRIGEKILGQYIWEQASYFRSDVYLEGISTSTETDMLVVDSNNKISKR